MSKKIVVVGSLNLDLVARVPHHPAVGETLSSSSFGQFLGGKGANQACAAALLGGEVSMVGRIGEDAFAGEMISGLKQHGVFTDHVLPVRGPSGVALIVVDEAGLNSIIIVPGANQCLDAAAVRLSRDVIAGAGVVLTQLETPISSIEETLSIACAADVPVILDPAPFRPLARKLLAQVSWLTPNETEAAALAGGAVPSRQGWADFCDRLLNLGPENVLLKLGEQGAFVATRSGLREYVPGHRVNAVDTTAAGDTLNGAFATALAGGADPVEAVRFGVAAAALSVTRAGAIASLPTGNEVADFRRSVQG